MCAQCMYEWSEHWNEIQNITTECQFQSTKTQDGYRLICCSATLSRSHSMYAYHAELAKPRNKKIQPISQAVSMDKCHLSSARMPELQWLSWYVSQPTSFCHTHLLHHYS